VYTLDEIASIVCGEIEGDPNVKISDIVPIDEAHVGGITFLSDIKYKNYVAVSKASAIIIKKSDFDDLKLKKSKTNCILVDDPYYAYSVVSHLFEKLPKVNGGIHPTVYVGENVKMPSSVSIGPNSVIKDSVVIGSNTIIGSGVVIGENVAIGSNCRIYDNVTMYHSVVLHNNIIAHSGVVIGSDGFGIAKNKGKWNKIAQNGSVVIYNDVEIGANTVIDRGALGNTLIGVGVKLDNLIQIGHNVTIGDHSAVAGCVAIAGSTKIGKNCIIGGAACIAGHLEIADNVLLTGMAGVSNSIRKAGIYSSGIPIQENAKWRRNVIRLKNISKYIEKIKTIEQKINKLEMEG
jgi:UDP-3-O-[3-hydroxymyristoyl] glucosamine N-acyltransferase